MYYLDEFETFAFIGNDNKIILASFTDVVSQNDKNNLTNIKIVAFNKKKLFVQIEPKVLESIGINEVEILDD